MTDLRTELATLIASRICHDLISPVGAIGNGLELVALSGTLGAGPEMDLITESCDNANARIRFFRVAYGAASTTAKLSSTEVRSILQALTKGSRLNVTWNTEEDTPRAEVQLGFLGLQCLETALRRGGDVTITPQRGFVTLEASAESIHCDPEIWRHLDGSATPGAVLGSTNGIAPGQVQFVLLPLLAADQGRKVLVTQQGKNLKITI